MRYYIFFDKGGFNLSLVDQANLYKKKGELYLKQGDFEKAREYFIAAIEKLREYQRGAPAGLKGYIQKAIDNLQETVMFISKNMPRARVKLEKKRIPTTKFRISGKPTEITLPKPTISEAGIEEIPEECPSEVIVPERPAVTFKDLAGLDDVKRDLIESIEWPIKYPEKLKKLGISPIKGVLLFGPPGCGKTFLVKCAAGEFGLTLLSASPASILSKYIGESEKIVSQMFRCAEATAPSIIFIDEVDKLLPLEVTSSDAPKRIEAQFLQEMDGIASGSGFIVIMATNEPWNLNPALIRPGRVDRIIYVPPPDKHVRKKLFELYLKGVNLEGITINDLVKMTEPNNDGYYSSSGIKALCDDMKRALFREWIKTNKEKPLTKDIAKIAFQRIKRSITYDLLRKYEEWAKKYASYQ